MGGFFDGRTERTGGIRYSSSWLLNGYNLLNKVSQLKQLLVCKSGVREVGWAAVSRISDPVLSYLTWFYLVWLVLLQKSLEFRKGSTSGVTSSRCRQSEEGDADIGAVHNMYPVAPNLNSYQQKISSPTKTSLWMGRQQCCLLRPVSNINCFSH